MVSFTVIIVTHGREELLMKCLDSLHPGITDWQLVIMANGRPLSQELTARALTLTEHLIVLDSDIQLPPGKARNKALESAEGEWIYFIDDDAYVLPQYWGILLPLLRESKMDVLGGPDSPASGMNHFGMALALTLSSPFCTGVTSARHKSQGKKIQYADEEKLTSCNLWIRKSALEGILFPEDYVRGEETVVLQKLKALGKVMYYHPKLVVAHHRRSRFMDLWRPSFYAGFSRSKVMKEKLKRGNDAFWLPAFFVLLHFFFFLDQISFWYLARMYASIILFVSIAICMKAGRFWLFPLVTLLHYFIVFMYGTGFLAERIRRVKG